MVKYKKNNTNPAIKNLAYFPEISPDPVIELDRSGRVVFANVAAKKSLRESGLKNNLDFFIPTDIDIIMEKLMKNKNRKFFREIAVGRNVFMESIHAVPKIGNIRICATGATAHVDAQKSSRIVDQDAKEHAQQQTRETILNDRTISMLSACNAALVRANKKEKLLRDICNIIVKTGGYKMAWVGEPLQNPGKSVAPIVQVGFEEGYLEKADISWSEKTSRGYGPTGCAIRERKFHIGRYASPDPALAPWRSEAMKRNFASSIALPLAIKDKLLGALMIYSEDHDAFDKKEAALLQELADNLTYGILSIEARQGHEKSRKYLAANNKILTISNQSDSKKTYLDNVVKYIKKISRCANVGIRVLNQDGSIPYGSHTGFDYAFYRSENQLSLDKDQCICTRVISGKHDLQDKPSVTKYGSFYTGDSLEYVSKRNYKCQGRFRGECVRCGFSSIAVIPICSKKGIIGAIHITDKKADALTLERIEFIEALTPLIGESIEKFNASDGLRENEMKYRELVENANSIILRLNVKGEVMFFNEFAESFFGYSKKEIIGRNSVGTFIPETESSGRDLAIMLKNIIKNPAKYVRNENENVKKNGERVWVAWRNKALYDKNGKIEGLLSIGNDITERKNKEKQLIESYKHMGTINRKISFLSELNQLTSGNRNRKEVIAERMLRPLVNFASANFGALFKYSEEKSDACEILASINIENYATPNIGKVSRGTCKALEALARSKSCLREHCNDLHLGKLGFNKKFGYCMLIPFNLENKLKAFILLGFEEKKDFSNQDFEFFDVFSSYASSLLVNTKLFK